MRLRRCREPGDPSARARYAGDTTTVANPMTATTQTSRPPAASTTIHFPTTGSLSEPSSSTLSARARPAVTNPPATASIVTTRRGARTTSPAMTAGTATTAQASCSRLVTQRPQCGAVAGAELGEDPLVEEAGDERDQHEIERDAELDRERRAA